ncbi:DUF86 domain-containing protein [Geoalkalibacter halelectricus]|uniref:DUF86 domain-containing protein n=1 Tax=Geoalkalibacter halelectricus TaxID=2847045 RepID=A0ABY5ZK70_9BACT|nr:DUF86 domain-containing protein [Geoalkalibacter halelectricus]UWZ79562.1 DUF86 domain-containing protein [Geoalkalibacter halelectricus]
MYLKDILAAIVSIESFVTDYDFNAFEADDKTLSAVIRKLEIIGEAVKQLGEDVRQTHPEIPWKQIAGMHDRLIHFYFGVNAHLVWQTVHHRLPELKSAIEQILDSTGQSNP